MLCVCEGVWLMMLLLMNWNGEDMVESSLAKASLRRSVSCPVKVCHCEYKRGL